MKVGERTEGTAATLAGIRRRCQPEPGDPLAKLRRCGRCGELFWDWRRRANRPCPRCCEIAQVVGNQQRSFKAGPEWERTVLAQLEFWLAECDRLGITPET